MTTPPCPLSDALEPALRRHAGERLPRYTSYPPATLFSPAVDAAAYRAWLGALSPETTASLYLHVPFCRALCRYCGCHTTIPAGDVAVIRYAAAMVAELETVSELLPAKLKATHLHFGGGTPTIIGPAMLERVMAAIRSLFALADDAEIAIEVDPRALTGDMAMALGAEGFTRASIGVQTLDPAVQQAIRRVQSEAVTEAAAKRLRAAGIKGLNVDLIYGLPYQTVESCVATARHTAALDPDRIAVFGYAHVPSLKPRQRQFDPEALPGADARFAQAAAIAETLTEAGYRPIGLDHFAKPGDALARIQQAGRLHRNFQGYTTDAAEALLGFGASAIGRLPQGYVQNTPRIAAYQDWATQGRLTTVRGLAVTAEDRLRAAVIERLMCDLEVDLASVAREHAVSCDFALERAALANLARDGLVELAGDRVAVKPAMRPFVRTVAAVFDNRRPATGTHAPAV